MSDPKPYLKQEIDRLNSEIEKNQALLADPELSEIAKSEVDKLKEQIKILQTPIETQSQTNDTPDSPTGPVSLEIRAAAGGDEAGLFAVDLLRMYLRFADNIGFKTELLDDNIVKIKSGSSNWPLSAYETFKYEAGVHRVQRVPVTESAGRIHTSTATVAVLPQVKPTQVEIKPEDLDWQFTTSGGPGGQNVNKLNTAVRLTHKPTGISVSVRQERTQVRNREIALEILRSTLWQRQEEERLSKLQSERNEAVGRGMRAEKIKTYNFPQNRLTDHRLNKSWYSLKEIIEGNLTDVIDYTHKYLENLQTE